MTSFNKRVYEMLARVLVFRVTMRPRRLRFRLESTTNAAAALA